MWSHDKYEELIQEEQQAEELMNVEELVKEEFTEAKQEFTEVKQETKEEAMEMKEEFSGELKEDFVSAELNVDNTIPCE